MLGLRVAFVLFCSVMILGPVRSRTAYALSKERNSIIQFAALKLGQTGKSKSKRTAALVDTHLGLHLSVTCDQNTFGLNDTFRLKIKLENVGDRPLTVYKRFGWGWSSSFALSISNSVGIALRPTFLEDHLPSPNFPEEDFTTFSPGASLEVRRYIDLAGYGIKEPGLYFVTVWYRSPVPADFAPKGLQVWSSENGRLQAKRLAFRVVK